MLLIQALPRFWTCFFPLNLLITKTLCFLCAIGKLGWVYHAKSYLVWHNLAVRFFIWRISLKFWSSWRLCVSGHLNRLKFLAFAVDSLKSIWLCQFTVFCLIFHLESYFEEWQNVLGYSINLFSFCLRMVFGPSSMLVSAYSLPFLKNQMPNFVFICFSDFSDKNRLTQLQHTGWHLYPLVVVYSGSSCKYDDVPLVILGPHLFAPQKTCLILLDCLLGFTSSNVLFFFFLIFCWFRGRISSVFG